MITTFSRLINTAFGCTKQSNMSADRSFRKIRCRFRFRSGSLMGSGVPRPVRPRGINSQGSPANKQPRDSEMVKLIVFTDVSPRDDSGPEWNGETGADQLLESFTLFGCCRIDVRVFFTVQ